ncbi:hypothetical protein DESC_750007 [Desulfosarcina cetonica]|nr:hypothetical protein DESC_750007 [Desulfosarcina cetonica]
MIVWPDRPALDSDAHRSCGGSPAGMGSARRKERPFLINQGIRGPGGSDAIPHDQPQ